MSKATFSNKWAISNGDAITADTMWNDPGDGIQDEIELARGDYGLDGVISGMTVTVSGATATIASGRASVGGNRYSGSGTVSFTGASSGDYYIYIDSGDDTTPYKKKTTVPTSGELTLATATFDGASTLSALDDNMKVLGVQDYDQMVCFDGTVSAGDYRVIPVLRDMWIEAVYMIAKSNGATSGSTIVDVHLGADGAEGTTIFTTQANRPSIGYSVAAYTLQASGKPNGDRKPDTGEHLTIEVDQITGTAGRDLTVAIKARQR